jgi:hypothetical protein
MWLIVVLYSALLHGACSQGIIVGARSEAERLRLEKVITDLNAHLKEFYFKRKGDGEWRKRFQCGTCQVAAQRLGSRVAEMRSWTTVVATEAHYEEEFTNVCDDVSKYKLVAVDPDLQQLINEFSPIAFVADQLHVTLTSKFIEQDLSATCSRVHDTYAKALRGMRKPSGRNAVKHVCVDGLKLCNGTELMSVSLESLTPEEHKRIVAQGETIFDEFLDEIYRTNSIAYKDIRCQSCDIALTRILEAIDYQTGARPSQADILKACGTPESAHWKEWGLQFDFWSEEFLPAFSRKTNLTSGILKWNANSFVSPLLHTFCNELANKQHYELNGQSDVPANCHHTNWCSETKWSSLQNVVKASKLQEL